jgi:hypothetical protein
VPSVNVNYSSNVAVLIDAVELASPARCKSELTIQPYPLASPLYSHKTQNDDRMRTKRGQYRKAMPVCVHNTAMKYT